MPSRLRNIKRALEARHISVEEPPKGSHWKATDGQTSYIIPCHNGLKSDVPDVYIRALCRAFGLDYRAFIREL